RGDRGQTPSPAVSIIGLGASGYAAARLALEQGETVHASDTSTDARTAARARDLEAMGARVDLGHHDADRIAAAGLVVVSPGIPPDAPVLRELRSRGVRWVSEPDFAVRFHSGSLIAVTGTNGKTTTSTLTAHLLEAAGISVALGGNVGANLAPPASELALGGSDSDWWVLEMSSFQLADVSEFSPDIGVVTNLAPDHLDRYPDTAAYFGDKARLFLNARSSSRWVLNGDDPATIELAGDAAGTRYLFAESPPESFGSKEGNLPEPSAYLREGVLTLRLEPRLRGAPAEESLVARGDLRLLGDHNVQNALAASLTARLAGAGPDGIRAGLRSFQPLPHRLAPVAEVGGVLWVDDSKATNVAAARSAVASLDRPLVLLLGGRDKGEDFRPLAETLGGRVRAAIVYGEAGPRIERELAQALTETVATPIPVLVTVDGGFDRAVLAAGSLARAGDIVLLAPACSSYDEFEDYEARGRRFAQLAREGVG
ncbi:MAG: UDP-N-acetylmuramoyl-L-alanine--D-glutamate ligase, partial [Gemmatimonadota bacterium]